MEKRDGCCDIFENMKPCIWVLPFIYNLFCMSAVLSLMLPFFPILASSKGLSAWEYGFTFAIYKATMVIGSLLAGKLITVTSRKTCYMTAQITYVSFSIAFGCLFWAPNGNVLLGLSIATAAVGGCVDALYTVVLYADISDHFKEKSGTVISFVTCLWQAGFMTGTSLGGVLIDLWDFPLPFFVFGALLSLSLPFIGKGEMEIDETAIEPPAPIGEPSNESANLWTLLLDPVYLAILMTMVLYSSIQGFNDTTLQPSLEEFQLTNTETGKLICVQFACSSIGALLAAVFCHFQAESFCTFVGVTLGALAYLILGPAVFMASQRTLWMIYLAQAFTGLATSSMFICAFCQALGRVRARGYPDTIRTKGFVSSSIFTAVVASGVVSPSLAGYIVQVVGYRMGVTYMFGLLLCWVPVTFAIWMKSLSSSNNSAIFVVKQQ
ncbi:MFS-type transporter SLC18B1 isoform X2 [Ixodes scapularis]